MIPPNNDDRSIAGQRPSKSEGLRSFISLGLPGYTPSELDTYCNHEQLLYHSRHGDTVALMIMMLERIVSVANLTHPIFPLVQLHEAHIQLQMSPMKVGS
jgi:hypothetical protein